MLASSKSQHSSSKNNASSDSDVDSLISSTTQTNSTKNNNKISNTDLKRVHNSSSDRKMEDMKEVEGIVFSTKSIKSHAAVASVLMQQPGKVRVKDLKSKRSSNVERGMCCVSVGVVVCVRACMCCGSTCSAQQNHMLFNRYAGLGLDEDSWGSSSSVGSSLSEGVSSGGGGVGGASSITPADAAHSRQMREILFERHIRQSAEFERSKELKWFVCRGRQVFTEQEKEGSYTNCCMHSHRVQKEAHLTLNCRDTERTCSHYVKR